MTPVAVSRVQAMAGIFHPFAFTAYLVLWAWKNFVNELKLACNPSIGLKVMIGKFLLIVYDVAGLSIFQISTVFRYYI